jgi:hypothetical protein
MSSLRGAILEAVVGVLRDIPGLGSVNDRVRSKDEINDAPSLDVFCGNEVKDRRPGGMADRDIAVIVRCYGERYKDKELDVLVDTVEEYLRKNETLDGLVTEIYAETIITDGGWMGYQGLGPVREINLRARWEALED